MTIHTAKALAAPPLVSMHAWDHRDVILYHLAIGAATGPGMAVDPRELQYVYEQDLQVLPSFSVIPTMDVVLRLNDVPGVDVDFANVLHGDQEAIVHRPLPPCATVENTARIVAVHDKGTAAVLTLEVQTRLVESGVLLATNRFGVFVRGEGGCDSGGEPPPRPDVACPPRAPDLVVATETSERQALLYRLTGDRNPLHAAPAVAARAGFRRPILHGLCTYGLVCKQVVDRALEGDLGRIVRYRARFVDVVYPGETIETSIWTGPDRLVLSSRAVERDVAVLTQAAIDLVPRSDP